MNRLPEKSEKDLVDRIRVFQRGDKANKVCADCKEVGPTYVCLQFSTFVCTTCSGIHREFSHKVKGISMSKWTLEEVQEIEHGGNSRAEDKWLARWDARDFPLPDGKDVAQIRDFLKKKYIDKRWLERETTRRTRGENARRCDESREYRAHQDVDNRRGDHREVQRSTQGHRERRQGQDRCDSEDEERRRCSKEGPAGDRHRRQTCDSSSQRQGNGSLSSNFGARLPAPSASTAAVAAAPAIPCSVPQDSNWASFPAEPNNWASFPAEPQLAPPAPVGDLVDLDFFSATATAPAAATPPGAAMDVNTMVSPVSNPLMQQQAAPAVVAATVPSCAQCAPASTVAALLPQVAATSIPADVCANHAAAAEVPQMPCAPVLNCGHELTLTQAQEVLTMRAPPKSDFSALDDLAFEEQSTSAGSAHFSVGSGPQQGGSGQFFVGTPATQVMESGPALDMTAFQQQQHQQMAAQLMMMQAQMAQMQMMAMGGMCPVGANAPLDPPSQLVPPVVDGLGGACVEQEDSAGAQFKDLVDAFQQKSTSVCSGAGLSKVAAVNAPLGGNPFDLLN